MARILVIEDNPTNMQLMVYLLKAFGHEPLEASDGEAGLAVARREPLDLVVCDIQLPRLDGYGVAKAIKSHPALRHLPLVAVTALAMVGDRDKVLQAGFDGYIAKPIAPEHFVEQVEGFWKAFRAKAAVPEPAPARPTAGPLRPAPTARATILAVDNTPGNLVLLRSLLEPFGYRVFTATNVDLALLQARERAPDLIISDLHMPGKDGVDFLRAIQAEPGLRSAHFMFLSSTVFREQDQVNALALGAQRFLTRPIEPSVLLHEIELCLACRCG